jgi:hypothetical protein
MPSAPPPPAQVDPGQSSLDFIRGMANPELQNELLAAEQRYRPEYNKLELADINTLLRGSGEGEDYVPGIAWATGICCARDCSDSGSESKYRTADGRP